MFSFSFVLEFVTKTLNLFIHIFKSHGFLCPSLHGIVDDDEHEMFLLLSYATFVECSLSLQLFDVSSCPLAESRKRSVRT